MCVAAVSVHERKVYLEILQATCLIDFFYHLPSLLERFWFSFLRSLNVIKTSSSIFLKYRKTILWLLYVIISIWLKIKQGFLLSISTLRFPVQSEMLLTPLILTFAVLFSAEHSIILMTSISGSVNPIELSNVFSDYRIINEKLTFICW